jgi:transcriptional regulator with XRE-family HTH domain
MTLTTTQMSVGERLQQLRKDGGLSVRTLATKAGFSPGFISQVEHGQASPSIASLERIAAVLGVTLGDFFAVSAPSPTTELRAADRPQLTSAWSRATIEALGPTGGTQMLEPLMITLAPGGRSGTGPHAAWREQFALVCAGEVMLTLPDGPYALTRGDAVSIAAETPHQWHNTSAAPAQVFMVSARAGSLPGKTSS